MPKPPEGLVDIPIVEKEVESHQPHYKVSLFLVSRALTVQAESHRSVVLKSLETPALG